MKRMLNALFRLASFYLRLNRHGHMLLLLSGRSEPPSGLWPSVLVKLTTSRDTRAHSARKDSRGSPPLHKVRVVHLLEADLNLSLGILWGRRIMTPRR
jgi:hypothetical protein